MAQRFIVPESSSVGFLGPVYSFSHALAVAKLPNCRHVEYSSFSDAFAALLEKRCNFALIPFYNTNGHDVLEAQREIVRFRNRVFVNDVMAADVEHCACGFGSVEDIKVVSSKKPVENQISKWLSTKVPGAQFVETDSTSAAIKELSETKAITKCAIGSKEAAEKYGVPILQESIQNNPNRTLFFLLSTSCPLITSMETVIISLSDVIVADIEKVVKIAEEGGCAMLAASQFRIEGMKYAYLEISAPYANLNLTAVISQVRAQCQNLALLGGYSDTSILTLVNQTS